MLPNAAVQVIGLAAIIPAGGFTAEYVDKEGHKGSITKPDSA
jgi:hypothetical protein